MNSTALPKSPAPYRIARLVGLGLAYLAPYFWSMAAVDAGYGYEEASFLPGPFQLLILVAMGYQAFRLVKPWHAGQRRAVLHNTNGVVEGAMIFFGLLCIYGSSQFGGGFEAAVLGEMLSYGDVGSAIAMLGDLGGDGLLRLAFSVGLPLLGFALMIGMRATTVIDGVGQRVISLGWLPRVRSFSDIEGLGVIEVRLVRRGGGHMGTQYWIGLFAGGKATKLYATEGAQDAEARLHQLQQLTGAPIGRRPHGAMAPAGR